MVTRRDRQAEAFEELKTLLHGKDEPLCFILVEGTRDVDALRRLSVTVPVDVFSHVGQLEHDIASHIAAETKTVLVLTDFDEKGMSLAKRITNLSSSEGVIVQIELRQKIGRLMGVLGLKTIESLNGYSRRNEGQPPSP
jgi:5S rRNA maturation endonuclease (ribonuclease M5)